MRAELRPVLLSNSAAICLLDKIPTGKIPYKVAMMGISLLYHRPDQIFVKETNGKEILKALRINFEAIKILCDSKTTKNDLI